MRNFIELAAVDALASEVSHKVALRTGRRPADRDAKAFASWMIEHEVADRDRQLRVIAINLMDQLSPLRSISVEVNNIAAHYGHQLLAERRAAHVKAAA